MKNYDFIQKEISENKLPNKKNFLEDINKIIKENK